MTRQANPIAPERPKRVPISSRNRLEVKNKEPGYVYRIVNDVDDRVERLQEAGYELCPDSKVGAIGSKRVDNPSSLGSQSTVSVGRGVRAVVMRQKEEYYKEDQAAKQAEIDAVEQSMKQARSDYGSVDFQR